MERAAKIFVWLAAANFVAFIIASILLGGDAIQGFAAHGHYFVSHAGHLTEVSRSVFLYSEWHAISVFITAPMAAALFSGMLNTRVTKHGADDLRRSLP